MVAGLCVGFLLVPAHGAKGGSKAKRVETFMKRNDANKDGVIDRSEFRGNQKRFKHLDQDHDGKLDESELTAHPSKPKASRKKKRL